MGKLSLQNVVTILTNTPGFTREYHQTITALTCAEQVLWIIGGDFAGSMNESKQEPEFRTNVDESIPLLLRAKQYLAARNHSITRDADAILQEQVLDSPQRRRNA